MKFHVDKETDLYHQNLDTLLDIYEANLEESIVIMYNYSDLFMYLQHLLLCQKLSAAGLFCLTTL